MPSFTFEGQIIPYEEGDSVLDALLRQKIQISFSCKQGECLSCLVRCQSGAPPASAQEGLTRRMAALGAFKACSCPAELVQEVVRPRN